MNATLFGSRAILAVLAAALAALTGCSDSAPVTKTPDYHIGTPTNRSSVQSWELAREPFYTQPGVNSGTQMPAPAPTASQRGFEPYDPVAERVYTSIAALPFNTRYISAAAKNGAVVLIGTVDTSEQLNKVLDTATHTPGVTRVVSQVKVIQPSLAKK